MSKTTDLILEIAEQEAAMEAEIIRRRNDDVRVRVLCNDPDGTRPLYDVVKDALHYANVGRYPENRRVTQRPLGDK